MDNDVFFNYLHCKYKGYLTLKNEKEELSEYRPLQAKLQQGYENAAISAIMRSNGLPRILQASLFTIADLKQGEPFIVNASLEYKSIKCQFHALKRMEVKSRLGSFYYVPVLFNEGQTIGKQQALFLSLGTLVLSEIQGMALGTTK
jgi:hypothetical protein